MKRTLYLGTDPTEFENRGGAQGHLIHYPVIKIVPRTRQDPQIRRAFEALDAYTHLIFTSKNAVNVFFSLLEKSVETLKQKTVIAVGQVTAAHLHMQGLAPQFVAQLETQEGIIALLEQMDLEEAYMFLPRSSLSRPVLTQYFAQREISFEACDLYDTVSQVLTPTPDLHEIDEIVFTSPSTVKGFMEIFGALPSGKKCLAIGPITQKALQDVLN